MMLYPVVVLSVFVAVNNLYHHDASFNKVQDHQSTIKQSSFLPFLWIGNLISCLLLAEVSTLFPKEKQASKFLF